MSCDLKSTFGALASRIPESTEESISLRAGTLPLPPVELRTSLLVIEKSHHDYDGLVRRDRLVVYAEKATYCHLGLLVASVLFAPAPRLVTLHLDHPASAIRQLVIRGASPDADAPGYHAVPSMLNYVPERVAKHPWAYDRVEPEELPGFFLTNANECVVSEDDWRGRDVVTGFGRDEGVARLVELLLNMSRAASVANEIALEGEGGLRGVAPLSCEATLLLPGAFGWNDSLWPAGEAVASSS